MIIENVDFYNSNGLRLSGRIYRSDPPSETGMIFCHGLFSNKDGYKITRLAEFIVEQGITLLTFDFSFAAGSGENIAEISILQEVRDLESASRFFLGWGIKKFHLMGSSMGGAVSLLYAADGPDSLISLISIATPVDLAGLISGSSGKGQMDSLPEEGMTALDGILIKNKFFRELKSIDMVEAAGNITVPVLIIHGCEDKVVDFSNARILENNLQTKCGTLYIEDGDHNLTRDSDIETMKHQIKTWVSGFRGIRKHAT